MAINPEKLKDNIQAIGGASAMAQVLYNNNLAEMSQDIDNYLASNCNAIEWFSNELLSADSTKGLGWFYDLAKADLTDFLSQWFDSGLTYKAIGLTEKQITAIMIYGLNPNNCPDYNGDNEILIDELSNAQNRVIVGWLDTVCHNINEKCSDDCVIEA